MIKYIAKRSGISLLVLLLGSLLMFILVINVDDPLTNLHEPNSPNRDNLIRQRIPFLGLDKPWYEHYLNRLGGAAKCLYEQCDSGIASNDQSVNALIASAAGASIRLVILATRPAIVTGVTLGILIAVRQYSGFDYVITMMTSMFFSPSVLWFVTLLKQHVAVELNNWIEKARFTPLMIVVTALVLVFIAAAIVGSPWKRRLITFGALAVSFAGIMTYFDVVRWFRHPAIGISACILLVIGTGALMIVLTSGLENKKVRNAVGATVLVNIVGYFVPHGVLMKTPSIPLLLGLLAAATGVGIMAGQLLGGSPKRQASFASVAMGLFISLAALADLLLSNWAAYLTKVSRPISTIGASTLSPETTWWGETIDGLIHLLLPTITLTLISIASYIRYTRASMLEALNQDYIRIARSKGVSGRKVITRHAPRNTLIPLVTIMASGFANFIGGVVIAETALAWQGMGILFKDGLLEADSMRMMGFFLVTGMAAVVMNMLAGPAHAFLDPKISR